jgi:hypothetical protein
LDYNGNCAVLGDDDIDSQLKEGWYIFSKKPIYY